MYKEVIYDQEATKKLQAGVNKLSAAVKSTLGPKGKNVALGREYGRPNVTHDGVTVARSVILKDHFEEMGAQLIKEAATKTNENAGDGTTTATIIAEALVNEGIKMVAAGHNPMMLRKGLNDAAEKAITHLLDIKKDVSTKEEKAQVATISSADKEIGTIIAEALDKVGEYGVVTVEDWQGPGIQIDYREGMTLDRGYVSPHFATDETRMESVIEKPAVFITDEKLTSIQDIVPALELFAENQIGEFVIIADEVDDEALSTLVLNKLKGVFRCAAIKAPGFGQSRKDYLQDIAAVTGATVISKEVGLSMQSLEAEHLGKAERIISGRNETVIVGGAGLRDEVEKRIGEVESLVSETKSQFDKEKHQERLARISGAIAVLQVGGSTDVEQKETKYRVEDAINATKAAVEEGIVPGGAVSTLRAREVLKNDEDVASRIMYAALGAPIHQLLINAGFEPGGVIAEIERNEDPSHGFNVVTEEYGSMYEAGVIDPVKVTRLAIQYATSVAINILTTNTLVTKELRDDENTSRKPA